MYYAENRSIHLHQATNDEHLRVLAAANQACILASSQWASTREDRSEIHPNLLLVTKFVAAEPGEREDFEVTVYWHSEPDDIDLLIGQLQASHDDLTDGFADDPA